VPEIICAEWGIHHKSSSPYRPHSNGVDEKAVKGKKNTICAISSTLGVFYSASAASSLHMFRNTPRSPTDLSPALIVFRQTI
jgi:hypothetical protein